MIVALADEAVRMPVGTERRDETVGDWILTAVALGRKQSEEVTSAVRHAILLMESITTKLTTALRTDEALHVEILIEGSHASIFNGTIASGTSGTELIVVVFFAVSFTVSFEEVPLSKFSAALAAHVVLRMPHFAERDDNLADNGLSTSSAVAFGDRRDAMLAAVLAVQRAQHRIGVRRVSRRRSTHIAIRLSLAGSETFSGARV